MLAGGSAVGALLTPAPWKLIKDSSLWSENWPGIPRPKAGPVSARYTNCSLCSAGCAVKARCVGKQPVFLSGAAGALCAYGIAGHHLPYHPARLRSGAAEEAFSAVSGAIQKCAPGERVAVLDLRPDRTSSWTYRRAMGALRNGVYLTGQRPSFTADLAAAKTVLSFGTPLLDGWGTPGSVIAARDGFRLIQAEAVESRTACLADEWLPVKSGSENALALQLANRLIENGASANRLPTAFLERVSEAASVETGIPREQIHSLADRLAQEGPALVLAAPESPDILALNLLLGAPGRTIVTRRDTPIPDVWKKAAPETELSTVPDGSLRVLLIDESVPGDYIPWLSIERKLTRDAVVVAFAWSREGYGRHARYVLPTAVYPEALDDVPPPVDSPVAVFRLSTPLVDAPASVVDPAAFIGKLAGVDASTALRNRAGAIAKSGRGSVFTYADAKSTPLKSMKPDDFWKALNDGACWLDDRDPKAPPPSLHFDERPASPLALTEERGAMALVSPILSKLYRESHVRLAPHGVAIHPSSGFTEGERAILQTDCGRVNVEVSIDSSVPPGVIQAASGPEVLDLCSPNTKAKVVRI